MSNISTSLTECHCLPQIPYEEKLEAVSKMGAKGTKSKDSLMTITETAKKLLVNTYKYFCDRLSGKYEMPSLASLIQQKPLCLSNIAN